MVFRARLSRHPERSRRHCVHAGVGQVRRGSLRNECSPEPGDDRSPLSSVPGLLHRQTAGNVGALGGTMESLFLYFIAFVLLLMSFILRLTALHLREMQVFNWEVEWRLKNWTIVQQLVNTSKYYHY